MASATSIGKFEILSTLGQGAGSTIFKIKRHSDRRLYALKVVSIRESEDQKYVDQCATEYDVACRLRHAHIVQAHGFEITRKLFRPSGSRLLLELVDGLPLDRCATLPLYRLVAIFFRVADGMTHMHERDVFHADMKPANIMVGANGKPKIIDLGLAWRRGERKDRVQGTLDYLAPEQALRRTVNEKTDIFNLGATMHHLLTGHPPPAQLREAEAGLIGPVDDLVRSLVEKNPAVPTDLDALVRQCIRHDPKHRPSSMSDVREKLREIGQRLKTERGI